MGQLTFLSLNCCGLPIPLPGLRTRLAALGATLAATCADVACLQEIGRWNHLPLVRHTEMAWPYTAAMEYPYAPKGGLVTLARHHVVDITYYTFQERGRAVSLHVTERYQKKGILQTHLMVDNQPVVVLNTHLAANYSARWSYTDPYAKVERAQLHELAALVRALPEEALVVVAGDLNVPRDSWLYQEFCALADLIDPLEGSLEPTYRPLPGIPARAAKALDYILVRAPVMLNIATAAKLCFRDPVQLARGTQGYLSDHLGVQLVLEWKHEESRMGEEKEEQLVLHPSSW